MATINYTKTLIGGSRFLVEWSGLTVSDVAQPFDAAAAVARAESAYLRVTAGSESTGCQIQGSNQSGTPTTGAGAVNSQGVQFFEATASKAIGDLSGQPATRWYFPVPDDSDTGTWSVVIMFTEG